MTDTRQRARTALKRIGLVLFIGAATVAGFQVAAWLKYLVSSGELVVPGELVIFVIYAAIIFIAAAAWLGTRRSAPGIARGLVAGAAAFTAGSLAAVIFAPSYKPPFASPGTLELRIESPFSAGASAVAECQTVPNGTDFAVATTNDLTGPGPYFVTVTVSIGGGASYDGPTRRDGLGLIIAENPRLGEVTEAEGSFGVFVANDSVELAITTEGAGAHKGSMSFANLRQTQGNQAFGMPGGIVLSGAVSWSCHAPDRP